MIKEPTVFNDSNETTEYLVTRAECQALIRKQPAGTCFYIRAIHSAPIVEADQKTGQAFPMGIYVGVKITKLAALRLAKELFTDTLENRGARVPCSEYVAVGSASKYRAFYLC